MAADHHERRPTTVCMRRCVLGRRRGGAFRPPLAAHDCSPAARQQTPNLVVLLQYDPRSPASSSTPTS